MKKYAIVTIENLVKYGFVGYSYQSKEHSREVQERLSVQQIGLMQTVNYQVWTNWNKKKIRVSEGKA